jgi:hypothetical protein
MAFTDRMTILHAATMQPITGKDFHNALVSMPCSPLEPDKLVAHGKRHATDAGARELNTRAKS